MSTETRKLLGGLLLAGLLFPPHALAGAKEADAFLSPEERFLFSEDDLVVSASRYEQDIGHAPATVYVLTDEDIRQSGQTSILEVLRTVPGLNVMTVTPTQAEVSARGLNEPPSNQMLILLDGRVVYNASYFFVGWNSLPVVLEDIKRIEVVLGPGSALYGANAFSGVISIWTKDPEEAGNVHLAGAIGNGHTYRDALLCGGRWGSLGWKLAASMDETDSWDTDAESGDMLKCTGSVEIRPAPDTLLRVSGGLSKGKSQVMVNPTTGTGNDEGKIYFGSLLFGFHGLEILSSYEGGNSDVSQIPSSISVPVDDTHMRFHIVDVEGQYVFDPAGWCRVIAGGSYRFNDVELNILDARHEVHEGGVFLQGELNPLEPLSLTLGGRYDHYRLVGNRWSWRGSLVYTLLEDHAVRLTAGNAYRNPSLVESYMDMRVTPIPPLPFVLDIQGNPELEPEEIQTYELGYQGSWWEQRLTTRLTLYYSRLRDIIFSRTMAYNPIFGKIPSKVSYVNSGGARAYGGELSLSVQWMESFSTYVNYAYQHMTYTQDDPYTTWVDEDGHRVETLPDHKVNWGARLQLASGLSVNLDGHYVSGTRWSFVGMSGGQAEDLDDYVLVNGRVAYRFWKDRLEVAVSGYNLLHDKHREYPLGEEVGTRVLGWLRLDL